MEDKVVGIIGNAGLGNNKLVAKALANLEHTTILAEEPREKVFTFKAPPPLPKMFIDPNEPVFNQVKHDATCAKNRKKRKKRKK